MPKELRGRPASSTMRRQMGRLRPRGQSQRAISGERLMALMSASCRMPRNGTGQWMKPIQRRYSDSERPDWSFRTISAFNGRDVFDHAASPWKPVSSTVPTSRCSAPLKYTSSPLASDAIKGTSARATLRHRSRSTTCAPRPSRAAISSPLSDARSEEHTSELQSHHDLVCRLLLEKKKQKNMIKRLHTTHTQLKSYQPYPQQ